jgi:hypothetical protein
MTKVPETNDVSQKYVDLHVHHLANPVGYLIGNGIEEHGESWDVSWNIL